jgi:hypothetical protein
MRLACMSKTTLATKHTFHQKHHKISVGPALPRANANANTNAAQDVASRRACCMMHAACCMLCRSVCEKIDSCEIRTHAGCPNNLAGYRLNHSAKLSHELPLTTPQSNHTHNTHKNAQKHTTTQSTHTSTHKNTSKKHTHIRTISTHINHQLKHHAMLPCDRHLDIGL